MNDLYSDVNYKFIEDFWRREDKQKMREGATMNGLGWKFLLDNRRSACGYEPPWAEGETRRIQDGVPVLCSHGYHDATSIYSALQYAPGAILARTRSEGMFETETNRYGTKRVSQILTTLAIRDVEREIHLWGCDCVERALLNLRDIDIEPNEQVWEALAVIRTFANKQASQKQARESRKRMQTLSADLWLLVEGDSYNSIANAAIRSLARLSLIDSVHVDTHNAALAAIRSTYMVKVLLLSKKGTVSLAENDVPHDDFISQEITWQRDHLHDMVMPLFAGVESDIVAGTS